MTTVQLTHTNSTTGIRVLVDSKLFYQHVHCHSECWDSYVTLPYSFSTTGSLLLLHYTLVKRKSEYASPVWNDVTTTEVGSSCFSRLLTRVPYT